MLEAAIITLSLLWVGIVLAFVARRLDREHADAHASRQYDRRARQCYWPHTERFGRYIEDDGGR